MVCNHSNWIKEVWPLVVSIKCLTATAISILIGMIIFGDKESGLNFSGKHDYKYAARRQIYKRHVIKMCWIISRLIGRIYLTEIVPELTYLSSLVVILVCFSAYCRPPTKLSATMIGVKPDAFDHKLLIHHGLYSN